MANKLRSYLGAGTGLFVATALLTAIGMRAARTEAEGTVLDPGPIGQTVTSLVRVANPTSDPVPVRNVNSTSDPVPVRSVNSAAAPELVRDVDQHAHQPVHYSVTLNSPDGTSTKLASPIAIPSGKRLVVENVSAGGTVPGADDGVRVAFVTQVGSNNNGPTDWLQLSTADDKVWAWQPMRLYFAAPNKLLLALERQNTDGDASVYVAVTGYLENL